MAKNDMCGADWREEYLEIRFSIKSIPNYSSLRRIPQFGAGCGPCVHRYAAGDRYIDYIRNGKKSGLKLVFLSKQLLITTLLSEQYLISPYRFKNPPDE